jgi:predicted nucleotidyltransferase
MADPTKLVSSVAEALAPLDVVRVAYVFGSQVSGSPTPDSDLDLAILFHRSLDSWGREQARRDVVAALAARLGRLGERVDTVDLANAGSSIAFRALREGCRVIARDERERVDLEVWIMRRYDDDARGSTRRPARGHRSTRLRVGRATLAPRGRGATLRRT